MRQPGTLLSVSVLVAVTATLLHGKDPAATDKQAVRTFDNEVDLLLEQYGPNHPRVRNSQTRAGVSGETLGPLTFVLTEQSRSSTTLRDATVRHLAGRAFLVGTAERSEFTDSAFTGNTVWIPIDTVSSIIELDGKGESDTF